MGKLLLARFRAGQPVTLIRGLTAEAVLAWNEKDLEPLSAHQRQAARCAAMATCEGYGPFIVAIAIDVERSFLRVEAENRFFPLDRSYLVWAERRPSGTAGRSRGEGSRSGSLHRVAPPVDPADPTDPLGHPQCDPHA